MDDAIQKYLEEHNLEYEINVIVDDEVIGSVFANDLDEAIAQSRKLEHTATDYANEQLIYSEQDALDQASKDMNHPNE